MSNKYIQQDFGEIFDALTHGTELCDMPIELQEKLENLILNVTSIEFTDGSMFYISKDWPKEDAQS